MNVFCDEDNVACENILIFQQIKYGHFQNGCKVEMIKVG